MPVTVEWTSELATFVHFQAWDGDPRAEVGVIDLRTEWVSAKKAKLKAVQTGP